MTGIFEGELGRDAESLVQQPASRRSRARRPAVARARAGRARLRRVRIPLPDRERRIPLDAGSRPRRRMGPAGPAGAGHRRHARHRRRQTCRSAPALERIRCSRPRPGARASACGKPISSPTRRAGSTTGATATTSIPAMAPITSTRWDENLHPGRGPGGDAPLQRTRRRQGRVLRRRIPHQDARRRLALGLRARPRGRARRAGQGGAHARRVHGSRRDQGRRAPRQRAQRTRRGGASANYRGRVGLGRRAQPDQPHRRLLPRVRRRSGIRPRQHPTWRAAARHRSGSARSKQFRERLRARRSGRAACSRPNTASATPTAAGTGRSTARYVVERAPDGSTRRVLGLVVDITARKMRETALSAGDQRFRAHRARAALRDLRDRRRDRAVDRRRRRARARVFSRGSAARRPTGRRSCIPTTSRCCAQWFDRGAESMVALQYRIRHRDGHYVTLLDSPCVVRDAAGKVVRIVGVAIDISEQARAQEALRASQELLQIVAAGTGDWLILVDTERRVQFINRGIRSHSRESIIGQRLDEIAVPEDRPSILAALTQVLADRRARGPAAREHGAQRRALLRLAHPRGALAGRHHRRGHQHHRDHRPPGGACTCAKRRRACSSCCTKAWWSSTSTT